MRFAYNFLILSILFICIWFAYIGIKGNAYYKRTFRWLMWAGVLMYINRLFGIAMEENYISYNDFMLSMERVIHYVLTVTVYALYAFFIYCLIDQFHYFSRLKKLLLFIPAILIDIIIISSLWTHLIFYVEDGTYY